MKILINWAISRLGEKTTWLGFIGSALVYLNLNLSSALVDSVASALLAIFSAIAIFYKEKKK